MNVLWCIRFTHRNMSSFSNGFWPMHIVHFNDEGKFSYVQYSHDHFSVSSSFSFFALIDSPLIFWCLIFVLLLSSFRANSCMLDLFSVAVCGAQKIPDDVFCHTKVIHTANTNDLSVILFDSLHKLTHRWFSLVTPRSIATYSLTHAVRVRWWFDNVFGSSLLS